MYGLIVVRILTGLPRFRRSQLPTATAATLIVRVGNIDGNGDVGYAMWIVDRGMWDVGYGGIAAGHVGHAMQWEGP